VIKLNLKSDLSNVLHMESLYAHWDPTIMLSTLYGRIVSVSRRLASHFDKGRRPGEKLRVLKFTSHRYWAVVSCSTNE
jgi:hypothetical protein